MADLVGREVSMRYSLPSLVLISMAWLIFFHPVSVPWSWIVGLVVILQFGYLFYLVGERNVFKEFNWWPIGSVAVLLVWVCVTSLVDSSIEILAYFISALLMVPLMYYLVRYFSIRIVVLTFLFVVLIHAQWGIVQFVIQDDFGLQYLGESQLDANSSGVAKFSFGDGKLIRGYGPYAHSNPYSGVMVLALILTVIWRRLLGSLFLVIAGVLALSILVSFSRMAMVALLLILLISFLVNLRNYRGIVSFGVVVFFLAAMFTPVLVARFNDVEDVAARERSTGARWALEVGERLPWWRGVGLGAYPLALEEYLDGRGIAHARWQIDYVHSVPLLLLREWGVIGSLGLIIVLSLYAVRAWVKLVWLIPILPLLLFDHYFTTQYGPLILLVGFVYLILHSEVLHPEPESLG